MAVFGGDFFVFVVDCFDGVELLKKWLVMLCLERQSEWEETYSGAFHPDEVFFDFGLVGSD